MIIAMTRAATTMTTTRQAHNCITHEFSLAGVHTIKAATLNSGDPARLLGFKMPLAFSAGLLLTPQPTRLVPPCFEKLQA
jgi:hypothetical protein